MKHTRRKPSLVKAHTRKASPSKPSCKVQTHYRGMQRRRPGRMIK